MLTQSGDAVQARRDLVRFRTRVVGAGCPGRIVGADDQGFGFVYTVRFAPPGLHGATVTVPGLTEFDVLGTPR